MEGPHSDGGEIIDSNLAGKAQKDRLAGVLRRDPRCTLYPLIALWPSSKLTYTYFLFQVSSLMVSLSLHTSFDVPLANPSVWGLLVVCVVSTISFYYVEEHYASEPVVPMRLLRMKTPALINIAMGFYTSTLFARWARSRL